MTGERILGSYKLSVMGDFDKGRELTNDRIVEIKDWVDKISILNKHSIRN